MKLFGPKECARPHEDVEVRRIDGGTAYSATKLSSRRHNKVMREFSTDWSYGPETGFWEIRILTCRYVFCKALGCSYRAPDESEDCSGSAWNADSPMWLKVVINPVDTRG